MYASSPRPWRASSLERRNVRGVRHEYALMRTPPLDRKLAGITPPKLNLRQHPETALDLPLIAQTGSVAGPFPASRIVPCLLTEDPGAAPARLDPLI
jgi:hypothetical protein